VLKKKKLPEEGFNLKTLQICRRKDYWKKEMGSGS